MARGPYGERPRLEQYRAKCNLKTPDELIPGLKGLYVDKGSIIIPQDDKTQDAFLEKFVPLVIRGVKARQKPSNATLAKKLHYELRSYKIRHDGFDYTFKNISRDRIEEFLKKKDMSSYLSGQACSTNSESSQRSEHPNSSQVLQLQEVEKMIPSTLPSTMLGLRHQIMEGESASGNVENVSGEPVIPFMKDCAPEGNFKGNAALTLPASHNLITSAANDVAKENMPESHKTSTLPPSCNLVASGPTDEAKEIVTESHKTSVPSRLQTDVPDYPTLNPNTVPEIDPDVAGAASSFSHAGATPFVGGKIEENTFNPDQNVQHPEQNEPQLSSRVSYVQPDLIFDPPDPFEAKAENWTSSRLPLKRKSEPDDCPCCPKQKWGKYHRTHAVYSMKDVFQDSGW